MLDKTWFQKFIDNKIVKIILFIIIVIVVLILPDIFVYIRELFNKIPIIKIIIGNSNIDSQKYVQYMMGVIIPCFALFISFSAYNKSKKPYETQMEHRKEEILQALNVVKDSIINNLTTINDLHKSIGDYNNLQIVSDIENNINILLSSKKITNEEYKYLKEFFCCINNLKIKHTEGQSTEAKSLCDKAYKDYFKSGLIECNEMLKTITNKLDKYIENEELL